MLRICLIVALVAGLAGLAVSQFKVKEKINGLNSELDDTKNRLTTSQDAERKARKAATDARAAEVKVTSELETTKADLATATAKATEQQARADDNERLYNTTLKERNDAQTKLAAWEALGPTADQIKVIMADNKKLVAERRGMDEDARVMQRTIRDQKARLDIYEGGKEIVVLPRTLKGKVLAVDPKYEFIVLDIGEKQGALVRGEMLVNRSGKLVAKVRILSVQENHCIANVLPDWKQAEIMEGDVVVVGI
jgi:hypothetical protein